MLLKLIQTDISKRYYRSYANERLVRDWTVKPKDQVRVSFNLAEFENKVELRYLTDIVTPHIAYKFGQNYRIPTFVTDGVSF